MDVTPPSVLRRLGIALAGLAVAALAGAACALSFDDLRALAVVGEARPDLAYLYPAAFDALLVVALVGVLLLRSARFLVRLQAAAVLVLLIVAAAAVNAATALRLAIDPRQAAMGVALAPWVMLAVALWIWLLMIKHVQAGGRGGAREEDEEDEADLVPFHRRGTAEAGPPPLVTEAPPLVTEAPPLMTDAPAPVLEPTPVVGPTPAPETPPVSPYETVDAPMRDEDERDEIEEAGVPTQEIRVRGARETPLQRPEPQEPEEPAQEPQEEAPVSEQVAEWHAAPHDEHAPERPQEPAQDARNIEDIEDAEDAEDAGEPPQKAPTRPVRWGDRYKPTDVLVHPRPDPRNADTQPQPIILDDDRPAPAPRAQPPAETAQSAEDELADTAPHPVIHDDPPAPSGRLRSTPRPPED
ncbi:DUF2637 domain-containing protein [Actinomadura sp. ATCC 31491]|uniref:DUF2637 domain-containing protein n=1 Tax=Actinomadura luzonensis TaxID=2805427 RepID=A0ABT0FRN5_9ACTN|nr:DUF2637 domain-containing protein [Actinomadura luzonensis]MCK2214986.1 DUF2637 domain-containing protein [Actinomadura luzonensis]